MRHHFAAKWRFEHIAFAYDVQNPVLGDVNFTIKPGQLVGIVGPTGSGKSTVVSMIPRFYDPTKGTIRIDGFDIRDFKIKSLRDQIGYVLQDTVLFHGTIAENIAFGRPGASREEIIKAAELANAHEFISKMAQGYDTMVGERGSTLSGGQRQRIGIARVMVRNNPILLLDEPTAALDTESEKLVIEALERLMKGRTVITIAHRLTTIRDADQIIVISGGVVAESGTHDELMAKNGIYAQLHRTQFDATAHVTAPDTPAAGPKRARRMEIAMSRSLIVLPDDSARPILDAINHAQKSLRIKMFVFSDPAILQAVIAAKKRGVAVRVMLNPARRSGESENEDSRKLLAIGGRRRTRQQSEVRSDPREIDGGG